ncbi:MAG: tetratricopeptide repeat protein, partial [candidate division Zixibacteria bacterium]|nr:tetratricopeptide repeat protein [candidate division Zixibacteria bacterium]
SVLKDGFEIIRRLNGSVARIDPFKSGHKLLVLFGAPVKQENDKLNALLCATQLLALSNSKFRIRIGLAAGPLFCGDVGATNRHEYTVMGDSVNLAARLMSKAAWDEILIDAVLRDSLPAEVLTEPTTLALKGIGNEVTCHKFVNISEYTNTDNGTKEIVGQKLPLERLTAVWNKIKAGSRQIVVLTGDAGVGKSALLRSFLQTNDPANCVKIECKNSILFGRGWLIRNLLQQLFEINPRTGAEDIIEFVGKTIDNKWLPLIQEILQRNSVDNVWTKGLTYELRLAKTRELFVQLVKALVTSPQSLVIDDFDRADEYSRSLIFSLKDTPDNLPLMLIAVAREEQASLFVSDNSTHFTEITVKVPSNDEWWDFFSEQFENGKREKELFTRILTVSKGNPQFITGFISHCTSTGQLVQNEISDKWEMFGLELQITIPENLANLQLAVFDNLQETQRYALKCTAVAVADFSPESISTIASKLNLSTIYSIFKDMVKQGVLYSNSSNSKFNFVHPSMRNTIYECLPESQLRDLHYKYGATLEQSDDPPKYDSLAFHFYRARSLEKGFSYSLKAAQESYKIHSLTECSVFFKQCMELLKDTTEIDIDIQQKLDFYKSYSEFLILEGRYSDAYRIFNVWRHLGKAERLDNECLRAATETARLLWQQTKYSRSRFFLDRVLACKDALEDREIAAKAYSVMAELERRVGEFKKAQQWSSKSVEIAVKSSDYQGISDGYNNLGLALWGEGKLAEAVECYQKSLELSKNHSGMYGQAKISNNLAIIQWELGQFIGAESLMAKAIRVFRDIGDRRNEAYASGNLAGLYRITGKLVKAEELFSRADLIFKRLDDLHAHHYTVGNLGDIDIIRGNLSSAESRYTEALEFARSVGDKELEAECNVRFGELSFFRKKVSESKTRYEQAIKMAEGIGSAEFTIRGKIGLARLCIGQKNYEKALVLIDAILEQASDNNAVISENEAVFLKGEFYRIRNQAEKAVASYNQVLEYARHQHVFELTLKSAVRLYELDTSARESSSEVLLQLAKEFCEKNGPKAWNRLLDSAYFSYFSTTIYEMLSSKQMISSDRL